MNVIIMITALIISTMSHNPIPWSSAPSCTVCVYDVITHRGTCIFHYSSLLQYRY